MARVSRPPSLNNSGRVAVVRFGRHDVYRKWSLQIVGKRELPENAARGPGVKPFTELRLARSTRGKPASHATVLVGCRKSGLKFAPR